MSKAQYDKISEDYSKIAKVDPSKQYVQYPEAIRLLGNVENEFVLDIGCGDGTLSRRVRDAGALVRGLEISQEQIQKAREHEDYTKSKAIYYYNSDIAVSSYQEVFDSALSNLVLLYAKDMVHLSKTFEGVNRSLKPGKEFVSITFNPDYQRLGVKAYNRIITKEDGKVHFDFLDNSKNIKFRASATDFSREDYEKAAALNGSFSDYKWVDLKVSEEGKRKLGDFWEGYEEDCPYVGFVATKRENRK